MSSASLRTSELFSGARAENSVLFSLDSIAPARPLAPPSPDRSPRPVSAAPADASSSGLIDLNSILNAPDTAATPRSLTAALPPPPRPTPAQPRMASTRAPDRSRGGLLAIIAVLGVATASLAVVAGVRATSTQPGVVVELPAAAPVESITTPAAAPTTSEPPEPATPAAAPVEPDDDESASEDADKARASAKPRARRARRPGRADKRRAKEPEPKMKPAPAAAKPEEPRADSVECLLKPELCKKPAKREAPEERPPPAQDDLPRKLSAAQLKAGVASAKRSAEQRCHAHAKPGEKIKIKLSISGSTGQVSSATSNTPGASAALSRCAADELKRAKFARFSSPQQGSLVTLRF